MSKRLMILEKREALIGFVSLAAGLCVLFGLVYWILYHPGRELETAGEGVAILVFFLFLVAFAGLRSGFALKERGRLEERKKTLWSFVLRVYRSPIVWVIAAVSLVIWILYLWRDELAAGGESEIGLWSLVCPFLFIVAALIMAALLSRDWGKRRRGWS